MRKFIELYALVLMARLAAQRGSVDSKIMAVVSALLLAVIILPFVINIFVDVDTSGWTGDFAVIATFWPFLLLLPIIGIGFAFFKMAQSK